MSSLKLKCFRGKEECGFTGEQQPDWTVKHDKRRSCVIKPVNQPSTVPKLVTCSLAASERLSSPCSERMKKKKKKNGRKRKTKPADEDPIAELPYSSVLIEGNNHTRDLAKHVWRMITRRMKVEGVCKPGVGLLDATSQVSPPLGSCCVIVAGTNDVASGVLDFNRIGRFAFTRHGMHLRPDSKHLLVELLVECMHGANRFIRVTPSPPPASPAEPSPTQPAESPSAPPLSALRRPVAVVLRSFAEAVKIGSALRQSGPSSLRINCPALDFTTPALRPSGSAIFSLLQLNLVSELTNTGDRRVEYSHRQRHYKYSGCLGLCAGCGHLRPLRPRSLAEPDNSFNPDSHREEPLVGPVSSMALFPVSEAGVARFVQELKPKKSCDINGMSVWLLKGCVKHLLTPLTKLINLSFAQGVFPSALKIAKVIQFSKKTILASQAIIVQIQFLSRQSMP
ncbi:hypothetical protein J6590_088999 [Homalodisca vitripennis]|nr:hypothetical protein J6590_088999 [Homalodisca vitripennis]